MPLWKSEDSSVEVVSFHIYMCSRDPAQVSRLLAPHPFPTEGSCWPVTALLLFCFAATANKPTLLHTRWAGAPGLTSALKNKEPIYTPLILRKAFYIPH